MSPQRRSVHSLLTCWPMTPGKFPEVANRGTQFRLERQGVGLVPLPKVGGGTCQECGTPESVAHSAFECPAHTQPREVLVETLDGVCSDLGLGSDHHWWSRSANQKLRASFCPTRGSVPVPLERAFFSRAASALPGGLSMRWLATLRGPGIQMLSTRARASIE